MFGISSMIVSSAVSSIAHHKAESELLAKMSPEDRAAYIERRENAEMLSLRRREVAAQEKQAGEGYGIGSLALAFIFGSSL